MYVTAKSYLSRNVSELLRRLSKLSSQDLQSYTVLFSISPALSCSNDSLAGLVTCLTSLPNSLGCLSAPVSVNAPTKNTHATKGGYTMCSIALFDRQAVVPFRSGIPGKETTQVGRWHAFRKAEDAKLDDHELPSDGSRVDWESVWAQKERRPERPDELKHLRSEDVGAVLYFTDQAPEGLCHSLEYFGCASKLGLVAHSTPFLTGRPFTMFYGRDIISTGAVGLCIRSKPTHPITLAMQYPDLHPITPIMTVTDSEGNLIHSMDDLNPSRLLLDATQMVKGSAKEDTYYVGVQHGEVMTDTPDGPLFNILSGDPSRGTIALDADKAPPSGARIRIYRRPASIYPSMVPQRGINLCTAATEPLNLVLDSINSSDEVIEITDTFLAASENGLVISRTTMDLSAHEETWKSALPGGSASISWV